MPASDFANKIINELKNSIGSNGENFDSSTPTKANTAIAKGISDYIINNTEILISYSGVTSVGAPITTLDTCSVTGACSLISGTSFDTWVKSIETNIVSGFFISNGSAGVIPVTPPPAFIPGLTLLQQSIKSAHEDNLSDPQKPVWEVICNSIITWINSIISLPYSATFSGSTGVATITKIILT